MNVFEMLERRYSRESGENWEEVRKHITSNPDIMDGVPVFLGTRIPVYIVLDCLSEGYTVQEILKEYPGLDKGKIRAALKFANYLASMH